MKIINKSLKELIPYRKNAKTHPKDQIEKIANSIKRFGFRQPIVVDKNNNVVVGHGRLLAAKKLGLKEVPCLIASDLSKDEINAYRLADNKLNESNWEMNLVLPELELLPEDLKELTGFDFGGDLVDESSEWVGMPEFDHKDLTPSRQVIVSFKNQEDVDTFAGLVDQKITIKTRSMWFPAVDIERYIDKRY